MNIHPATKEQYDLLFQKMKKAGYEWDAEKKELKRVSQRIISAEVKEAMYAKPAWSEEDDAYKDFVISAVEDYYDKENPLQKELVDWLKSLKDRVPPKQEWSEEDEITRKTLTNIVNTYYKDSFGKTEKCLLLNWLKYLKQRIGG